MDAKWICCALLSLATFCLLLPIAARAADARELQEVARGLAALQATVSKLELVSQQRVPDTPPSSSPSAACLCSSTAEDLARRASDRVASLEAELAVLRINMSRDQQSQLVSRRLYADGKGPPALVAAKAGRLGYLKILLETNKHLMYDRDDGGWTPVMKASRYGHVKVVNYLTSINPKIVHDKNYAGWTSALEAAKYGHTEVMKKLLALDPQCAHDKTNSGWTPALHASKQGHSGVLKALIDSDSGVVHDRAATGTRPVLEAAWQGHIAVMKLLITADPSVVHDRDGQGWTAATAAALFGRTKIVEVLITDDPSVINDQNGNGMTPAMLASYQGNGKTLDALIKAVDSVDEDSEGFIMYDYFTIRTVMGAMLAIGIGSVVPAVQHRDTQRIYNVILISIKSLWLALVNLALVYLFPLLGQPSNAALIVQAETEATWNVMPLQSSVFFGFYIFIIIGCSLMTMHDLARARLWTPPEDAEKLKRVMKPKTLFQDPNVSLMKCIVTFALMFIFACFFLVVMSKPIEMRSRTKFFWALSLPLQVTMTTQEHAGHKSGRRRDYQAVGIMRWIFMMDFIRDDDLWGAMLHGVQMEEGEKGLAERLGSIELRLGRLQALTAGREGQHDDEDNKAPSPVPRLHVPEVMLRFWMTYLANGFLQALIVYMLPLYLAQSSRTGIGFALNSLTLSFLLSFDDLHDVYGYRVSKRKNGEGLVEDDDYEDAIFPGSLTLEAGKERLKQAAIGNMRRYQTMIMLDDNRDEGLMAEGRVVSRGLDMDSPRNPTIE